MGSCREKRISGLEPQIGEFSGPMVHLKGMHEAITGKGTASQGRISHGTSQGTG